jgi:hypothetical protein
MITMQPDTWRMRLAHYARAVRPVLVGMGLATVLIFALILFPRGTL